ncbi:MAG: sterol desaturase family protein [Pseudomonadota bacterium]
MDTITGLLFSSFESALQAAKSLAIPFLFFVCIGFVVRKQEFIKDLRRAFPQSVLNLKIMFFNVFFVVPLIFITAGILHAVVSHYGLWIVEPGAWSSFHPVIVILLAVFIGDFTGYWRHRFEHTPILWPSHAVHHSDDEMTWLTLERFHPLNRITTFAIDGSVLLLMGFPAYAVMANYLVRHYYGFFIHADLPWTYGKASWIFVSPAMHRWHHSTDPRYFYTNFATVFSIFDRCFGTYRVPGPCTAPLGVTDSMNPTLMGQLSYMFQARAYSPIKSGKASFFFWGSYEPRPAIQNDECDSVQSLKASAAENSG